MTSTETERRFITFPDLIEEVGPKDPETLPTDEVAAAAQRQIDAERERETKQLQETAELLAKAGLDRVPTVEEAKAILDARRAEIRQAVLEQADRRDWCYDGTRQVCANLRLPKPDDRKPFSFRTRVVLELEVQHTGFTKAGAISRLERMTGDGRRPLLSAQWFNYGLGGVKVLSAQADPLDLGDGRTFPVGDKQEGETR